MGHWDAVVRRLEDLVEQYLARVARLEARVAALEAQVAQLQGRS